MSRLNVGVWLLPYIAVSGLHLYAIARKHDALQRSTKPLLMPLLILWVWALQGPIELMTALCFGFAGDVLLIYKDQRRFLLLGIFAFLAGHLCYIHLFMQVARLSQLPFWAILLTIPYIIFSWIIFQSIAPGTGSLRIPVAVYMGAIMAMSLSALAWSLTTTQSLAWLSFGGSVLFVVSDSILAMQIFGASRRAGTFHVMRTYLAAQLLIAAGLILR